MYIRIFNRGGNEVHQQFKRKLFMLTIISAVLVTSTFTVGTTTFAASTSSSKSSSAVTTNKVNTISLSNKSYASLQSANVMMNEKGNVFTYTIAIFNNGSSPINFIDYWVEVKSKSGKKFKTQLITADKDKKYIQPGSSQVFTFYSEVESNLKATDMLVNLIKWDFSATNFTRTIGTFKIPSNYSSAAVNGSFSTVSTGTTKFKTRVENATIIKDTQYYYLDMVYSIENIGYKSSDLTGLIFNVITPGQSLYSVNTDELKDITLQPGEKRVVTLRAAFPKSAQMYNLQLVASTNEETDKILVPRGIYKLQQPIGIGATAIGKSRNISIQSQETSVQVTNSYFVQSDSGRSINAQISFINKGKESVVLADYVYLIRTKSNVVYTATASKNEATTEKLLPNTTKNVNIAAEIPNNVDMTGAELLIYTPKTETTKQNYLLSIFSLPLSINNEGEVGKFQKLGNYSIRLDNVQRLPWNSNDVISATLTIRNETNNPQKIPTYKGAFVINGVKLSVEQTKTVYMDDMINIPPDGETQITVHSKIPYTTTISDVRFLLEDKIDDKTSNVVMTFGSKNTSTFTTINQDESFMYNNVGHRSNITVANANVYKSDTGSNVFYGEIVLQNMEERYTAPSKLRGLIKLDNGKMIPLQASDYKKTLLPDGRLLLSFWANLPNSYEGDELQFIVGQGVTGDKLSSGEDVPDALVNGVAFDVKLDNTNSTQIGTLENIKFSDYVIGVRKLYAYLNSPGYDVQGMKLDFEYDLIRSSEYDAVAEEHKIVLEIVDKSSNTKYSKEFALNSGKEGEDILSEGTAFRKSISFDDKDISNKITKFDKYTVNIYDKVGDTKLLLASRELTWFIAQW